ncbi:MAG: glutamate-1-semialdehyde 2,1-aminomutase [Bacteroidota bacterium]
MTTTKSEELFARAVEKIPGGVNSPVRAFKSVGGNPVFIERGENAHFWDVDGNEYIDYVMSWGPLILGHAHHEVTLAIQEAASRGASYGAPTKIEVKMAELICSMVPSVEMVRMVNSGTEATMSAIRLARAYTKKKKIIKFEGCYHGHGDSFLIKAGSGALTLGVPSSPGVPDETAALTLNAVYNDLASVEKMIAENSGDIAAIIVEPVAANMGVVVPAEGFLKGLRDLATQHNVVLIFDEVLTGFRLSAGGAQERFGVRADLVTMGKVIGGGLPVGAYGGKREIMQLVAPSGPMYQAGTLSGNPLAMTAGFAALSILKRKPIIYEQLEAKAKFLAENFREAASDAGVAVQVNHIDSLITVFFTENPVLNYADAITSDTEKYGKFFHAMLNEGVYLPPAQFEAMFVSTAHTQKDLDKTVDAFKKAIQAVK